MDTISIYLGIAGAVWAGTEFLPLAIPPLARLPKASIALILGPLMGAAAAGVGLVEVGAEGWKLWASGGLGGLLATFLAAGAHVTVIKPASRGRV